MAVCVGFIKTREIVFKEILDCNEYVATHCYFCKNCWKCKVTKKFNLEIERKGLKTFNSDKKW